ncbi:DNA methyltransferase [Ferrimonas marina]|uniref:Site-specific DNA-methyltransferase (Adenine-specific) n=1 Tax=Ferrimonas marina TaxID=299255 RepID=A0A1M5RRL1_9GAMM|nr:DNA methyltransferase [Ferrimonas marina]SHH28915.1 site-specific DNA-methyltransferase (adenine-specific) [Ferrimonas marina]
MTTYQLRPHPPVDWLEQLGKHTADLLITSLVQPGRCRPLMKVRHHNPASRINPWYELCPEQGIAGVFEPLYRVLKPQSQGFVLCEQSQMAALLPMAQAAGFRIGPARIWQRTGRQSQLYFLLHLCKGRPVPRWQEQAQILSHPSEPGRILPHALLETLLLQASDEGDLVIDPFMPDHAVAHSALSLGRRFAGAHPDNDHLDTLRAKLNELPSTELMRPVPPLPVVEPGQMALL